MKKPRIEKNIEKEVRVVVKEIERFEWKHRNLVLLLISIFLAYFILKSKLIHNFLTNAGTLGYLDSFVAGLLFPYGLTAIPATAAFIVLSENLNPFLIAFIAAIGAVISDYLIFRFIGNRMILGFEEIVGDMSKKLKYEIEKIRKKVIKSKISHHLIPILAGFIIASPLPDELAAVLFGSVKFNPKSFLTYAYTFHFTGILIITVIGKVF